MVTPIFQQWPEYLLRTQAHKKNHVIFGQECLSWYEIYQQAQHIASQIHEEGCFVIDPNRGIESIIALLSIALKPNCSFIWSTVMLQYGEIKEIWPGIYWGVDFQSMLASDRPYYGTLTSGSSTAPKICMGYADSLVAVGQYYQEVLYAQFPDDSVLATCLPLVYSATFMMVILCAWINAREVIFFDPTDWQRVLDCAQHRPTVIVLAPSMLETGYAYVREEFLSKQLTFLITAGYLSQERYQRLKRKFPLAGVQVSYGSTETGVMTLGEFDCKTLSVGKPLWGKPIWLREMQADTRIGIITTAGIDCREFYWSLAGKIKACDGTVSNMDYGHFDEDGDLYLDGRVDGAVKMNGRLLYPNMIERYLLSFSGVLDAKIHILSRAIGTEYIEAVVIGDVNEYELVNYCQQLEAHLRPSAFKIVPEASASYSERGKLQKTL